MKKYELVVLTTVNSKGLIEQLKTELAKEKVEIKETRSLGVKSLAYPIKKQLKANYSFFSLQTKKDMDLAAKINRFFYLNNKGYLRHLLVTKED